MTNRVQPIKKSEAGQLGERDLEVLDRVITLINDHILQHWDETKDQLWINLSMVTRTAAVEHLSEKVLAELRRQFKQAGWTLEVVHDQREGSAIKLS